jgi:hypothetical protein
MNAREFNNLEANTKVLIKAWDHENNVAVETVATFNGWCDHPDWGTAVSVSYENQNCHFESLYVGEEGKKETETDIPVTQFQKAVIKVMEVA